MLLPGGWTGWIVILATLIRPNRRSAQLWHAGLIHLGRSRTSEALVAARWMGSYTRASKLLAVRARAGQGGAGAGQGRPGHGQVELSLGGFSSVRGFRGPGSEL